jgi:hypothetical protein
LRQLPKYEVISRRGRGSKSKCEKCGKIIEGGRIKLNQHKKEFHSY